MSQELENPVISILETTHTAQPVQFLHKLQEQFKSFNW